MRTVLALFVAASLALALSGCALTAGGVATLLTITGAALQQIDDADLKR